jgi:threonylcarbamoyladenosine tRNA methylthiotransferase MtaB
LAKEYASQFEGEVLEVIPEEQFKEEDGLFVGYTDNYLKVILPATEDMIGQIVRVKISKAGYPYNEGQFIRVLDQESLTVEKAVI